MLVRRTLLIRISGVLAAIAVLAFALHSARQVQVLGEALRDEEMRRAEQTGRTIGALIEREVPRLRFLAQSLRHHEALGTATVHAVRTGEMARLRFNLDRLFAEIEATLLLVTDTSGRVLYRAHRPELAGDLLTGSVMAAALAGENALGFAESASGKAIRAVVPLIVEDKIVGAVMVGTLIDHAFALRLSMRSQTDVSFATEAGIWASSLPVERRGTFNPRAIRAAELSGVPSQEEIAEWSRIRLHWPMPIVDQVVHVLVDVDATPKQARIAGITRDLVGFSILVLALAIAVGTLFTLHLFSPLRALREKARGLARAWTGREIEAIEGNEIQALASALDLADGALNERSEALRRAEERLHLALSGSDLVMWEWDIPAQRLSVSPSWREFIEDPGASLVLTTSEARAIIPASDHAKVDAHLTDILTGRVGVYRLEHRVRTAKGAWKWMASFGKVVARDANGRATLVIGTNADVTQQMETAIALRESEHRLRLVVDNVPAMIAYADADRRYRFVNRAYAEWCDRCREDILGRTVEEILGPTTYAAIAPQIGRALAGERVTYDRAYVRESGRVTHAVTNLVPDVHEDGRVRGYYTLLMDITARKVSELAARENEAKFRSLTDLSSDWYWEQDADLRFVDFRGEGEPGLARALDLYLGKRRWELPNVHPVSMTWEEHRGLLEAHVPFRDFIMREVPADGQARYLSISGTPMFDDDGSFRGYRGIGKDVTAKRRAEEAIAEARAAAETANRAKSQFLANMSHEIRTPMNGVLGMAELLLETPLNDRQYRFAQSIQRSGSALLGVINDILDFSKIEAGRLDLEAASFDLIDLCDEVLTLFAETARGKGTELTFRLDESAPTRLVGDPLRLRQILTNLVGNALKFTSEGEVALEVGIVPDGASGEAGQATGNGAEQNIRFRVRDTGVGMNPETTSRLFTAFSQADSSTTRKFGGSGLGLAISKQLAELMGGSISVESELGKGSIFSFSVRLQVATGPGETATAMPELQGVRILVVDDDATARTVLRHHLVRFGMRVSVAPDGPDALEALRDAVARNDPFDVALVDVEMPRLDGIEFAAAVRADASLERLRLILLSAVDSQRELREARSAGFQCCVVRPIRQAELGKQVVAGLRLADPGQAAASAQARVGARSLHARVLLAEDNQVNQEIALVMLEKLGCHVTCVETGTMAVAAHRTNPFDLVLMDCQMPAMDGFAATRAIRALEAAPVAGAGRHGPVQRTPIVALTANAMQGDRDRCLAAGMDDYLSKPFSKSQLEDMLLRWLSPTPSAARSRRGELPASPASADRSPVLDPAAIAAIRELQEPGEEHLLERLVEMYLTEAPRLIATVGERLRARDMEGAILAAHTLKSSSAYLGAARLAALCTELETKLGSPADDSEALASSMEITYGEVARMLRRELPSDTKVTD